MCVLTDPVLIIRMIIPDRHELCGLKSAVRRTGTDNLRVSGLRADTLQAADLAGKSSDLLLRRVNSHTDDIDSLFPVGNSHPADDVLPVVVQYAVNTRSRKNAQSPGTEPGRETAS